MDVHQIEVAPLAISSASCAIEGIRSGIAACTVMSSDSSSGLCYHLARVTQIISSKYFLSTATPITSAGVHALTAIAGPAHDVRQPVPRWDKGAFHAGGKQTGPVRQISCNRLHLLGADFLLDPQGTNAVPVKSHASGVLSFRSGKPGPSAFSRQPRGRQSYGCGLRIESACVSKLVASQVGRYDPPISAGWQRSPNRGPPRALCRRLWWP